MNIIKYKLIFFSFAILSIYNSNLIPSIFNKLKVILKCLYVGPIDDSEKSKLKQSYKINYEEAENYKKHIFNLNKMKKLKEGIKKGIYQYDELDLELFLEKNFLEKEILDIEKEISDNKNNLKSNLNLMIEIRKESLKNSIFYDQIKLLENENDKLLNLIRLKKKFIAEININQNSTIEKKSLSKEEMVKSSNNKLKYLNLKEIEEEIYNIEIYNKEIDENYKKIFKLKEQENATFKF